MTAAACHGGHRDDSLKLGLEGRWQREKSRVIQHDSWTWIPHQLEVATRRSEDRNPAVSDSLLGQELLVVRVMRAKIQDD